MSIAGVNRHGWPWAALFLGLTLTGCNSMHKAAQRGDVATVVKGLTAGKDVNLVDHEGRPLITLAAAQGQLPVMRELIGHGADLEKKDSRGMTPLYIAAGYNQLAAVQELVGAGATVDSLNTELELTPLMPAAEAGYKAVVEYLLEKGAAADARARDGQTALSRLARTNSQVSQSDNLGTAQLLLAQVWSRRGSKGAAAYLNQADSHGLTALHRAAGSNNAPMISWLLKNGAQATPQATVPAAELAVLITPEVSPFATPLQVQSGLQALLPRLASMGTGAVDAEAAPAQAEPAAELTRWTPLHSLALHCGAGEAALQALLAGGAQPRAQAGNGRTALQLLAGCSTDPAPVVKLLLDKARQRVATAEFRRFLGEQGESGSAALITAVGRDHAETTRLLLAAGASPNVVGKDGKVALHLALASGNTAILKHLLAAKADPNLADGSGTLPLTMMVAKGDTAAVQLLLGAGARPNVVSGNSTSLLTAVAGGHLEIVQALLAARANPDLAPAGQDSALLLAVERGQSAIAAALLAAGADTERARSDGMRPLHAAVRGVKPDLVKLLLDHKANPNTLYNKGTALYWAVQTNNLALAQLLLAAKADPNLPVEGGANWTPLHRAAADGNTAALQMLVAAGADRARRNSEGKTADDLARERAQRLAAEAEAAAAAERQRQAEKQNSFQWGKFAAMAAGMAPALGELDSQAQADLLLGAVRDSMGGQQGMSSLQKAADDTSQRLASSSGGGYAAAPAASMAGGGGGADWTPEPNILEGSAACAGYTVQNYKSVYAANSSGPDGQLHSLCAGAYSYYWMYLNAKKQGYSKQEAQRTYDVFLDAARTAESFYANNRSTGGLVPG